MIGGHFFKAIAYALLSAKRKGSEWNVSSLIDNKK